LRELRCGNHAYKKNPVRDFEQNKEWGGNNKGRKTKTKQANGPAKKGEKITRIERELRALIETSKRRRRECYV